MKRCKGRNCRRVRSSPEISLTPLIDTALTLLVIFMVTAPIMKHGVKIDLPNGRAQETSNLPRELVVEVDKTGSLFFGGKQYSLQELVEMLKVAIGNEKERTVFVRGDSGTSYGIIMNIVDQIKYLGGVQYVALDTKQPA